jgi:hypothetical protein
VNKGFRRGALNRNDAETAVYDEVLTRFGAAIEPSLREAVEPVFTLRKRSTSDRLM